MADWREQFSKTTRSLDDLHGAQFLLVGEIRVLTYTATRYDAARQASVEPKEVDVAAPRRWYPFWW